MQYYVAFLTKALRFLVYHVSTYFYPPKDFKFLQTFRKVPITLRRPTEIPLRTYNNYVKDEYRVKKFLQYLRLSSEPTLTPYEHVDVAYFGHLHKHQWGSHPKDHPDLDITFRDKNKGTDLDDQVGGKLSSTSWHTGMSYEVSQPCTTFLNLLTGPQCGGDTLFVNCMMACDRLLRQFQQFLESLSAVRSGTFQSSRSLKSSVARRPVVATVHPVVRKHPVTGRRALWMNQEHIADIVRLKKGESDMILDFLYDHIHRGIDFQTWVTWEEGTFVVYDTHGATLRDVGTFLG